MFNAFENLFGIARELSPNTGLNVKARAMETAENLMANVGAEMIAKEVFSLPRRGNRPLVGPPKTLPVLSAPGWWICLF